MAARRNFAASAISWHPTMQTCIGVAILGPLALAPTLVPTRARAQSTGTEIEEVLVIARPAKRNVSPLIDAEQATKARSSIDQDYLDSQNAGQTVLQSVNLLPGVFFANNDPYGNGGGSLFLRGFDANRISLTIDGIPLNDSGNYALFSNQLMDPELVARVSVSAGTTDVDSPTASAAGGTINIRTVKPSADMGAKVSTSIGSFDYHRVFASLNSGETIGGIRAQGSASFTRYDKFTGTGTLDKKQYNLTFRREFARGDFVSLSFHYNINRNDFYRTPAKTAFNAQGRRYDYGGDWVPLVGRRGLADNEGAGGFAPSTYFALHQNPSDTFNIRVQSSFRISDSWRITFDPSFQYTKANGGGSTVIAESDSRLRGLSTAAGVDLNGDGDALDRVRLYIPSNTRTQRPGVNLSLLYDINANNRARVSYTYEHARHRQTAEAGFINADGTPQNIFAGLNGLPVRTADGAILRERDRLSIAELSQISADYRYIGFDGRLKVNLGLRAPVFNRDLNQNCWTLQSSPGGVLDQNQFCTTQAAPPPTNGQRLAPYTAHKSYSAALPNLGTSFEFAPRHSVFASYAESLSAPRTDNLYSLRNSTVIPETTKAIDFGYRYQGDMIIGSVGGYVTDYRRRIVTVFDPDTGVVLDRNVGNVNLKGLEAELGVQPMERLSLYLSTTITDSSIRNDLSGFSTTVPEELALSTARQLVGKPSYQAALRLDYKGDAWRLGLQGKYTAKRFSTDVNDEYAPPNMTLDLDLRYKLPEFGFTKSSELKLNITNITDRNYLSAVTSSHVRAKGPGGQAPDYSIGAPRTFQATLVIDF